MSLLWKLKTRRTNLWKVYLRITTWSNIVSEWVYATFSLQKYALTDPPASFQICVTALQQWRSQNFFNYPQSLFKSRPFLFAFFGEGLQKTYIWGAGIKYFLRVFSGNSATVHANMHCRGLHSVRSGSLQARVGCDRFLFVFGLLFGYFID